MTRPTLAWLLLCALAGFGMTASAEAENPPVRVKLLTGAMSFPIAVAAVPGDAQRIFVAERAGKVKVVDTATGTVDGAPVLDITPLVNLDADNGLLGLVLDTDYANNGYFYVYYTTHDGQLTLERYHTPPGTHVADPMSAYTIWRHPQALGHDGGWIGFSPINGLLYVFCGDGDLGGSYDNAGRAQDLTDQPCGKILRIDPWSDDFPLDPDRNYHIPPGNPFVGLPGDDEIWAYGLRNPWRGSFDRLTGDLYFGDVGFTTWEELNCEPSTSPGGRNYGWPCMEGANCTPDTQCVCNAPTLTLPMYDYPHMGQGRSVTGGYVYRGSAIPSYYGLYFFADFQIGKIWSMRPDGAGGFTEFTDRTAEFQVPGALVPIGWIASFGEDAAGELYICDIFNSKVFKVDRYPCEPVVDVQPVGGEWETFHTLSLQVTGAGYDPLTYKWRKGEVELSNGGRISGANSNRLAISGLTLEDAGWYDVVLTSPCGTLTSVSVEVTVVPCRSADFNGNGAVTVQDLFDFLGPWFAGDFSADFTQDFQVSIQDLFSFLSSWFVRCM